MKRYNILMVLVVLLFIFVVCDKNSVFGFSFMIDFIFILIFDKELDVVFVGVGI